MANIPTDERHVWFEQLIVNDGRVDTPVCEPERTVAMLQYTGGTTGTPKGAELTHANVYVNAMQVGRWLQGCKPGQERILGVLPLFHIFGMATVMNAGLQLGAELILLPRFEIDQLLQTIHRKRPTIFPAVPTLFAAITRCEARSRYDLSSIEIGVSGGAPLPADIKDSFEHLTGCVIVEGYGLTEASPVVCINPVGGVRKTGSIGLPLPLTTLDIVSLEDGRHPSPARRARGAVRARPAGDARLSRAGPPRPRRCSPAGICIPATSSTRTRTATCSSSTGSRTSS